MCAWKFFFGFDCPGCGLTRSVLALFAGRWQESVAFHPMGIVVVLWLANFWWFKKLKLSFVSRQLISCAVLVGFFIPWIIKIIV